MAHKHARQFVWDVMSSRVRLTLPKCSQKGSGSRTRMPRVRIDNTRARIPKRLASEFYASSEWADARKIVFARDGSRCACCGRTDVPMQVDHIWALRKHWHLRLDLYNLQVLCFGCNGLKSDWCSVNFRMSSYRGVDNIKLLWNARSLMEARLRL